MKPNARVVLGTLLACSVLAGCTESTLFDAPERGGAAVPPVAAADGSLLLVTALPYQDLAKIAEGIPAATPIGGKGQTCINVPQAGASAEPNGEGCYRRPYLDYRGFGIEKVCAQPEPTTVGAAKQCADYEWTAEIRKDGIAQLSRAGSALKLVQPVQVTGKTSISGDLAKVLPLKGNAIDIKAKPGLGLTATLDKAWCPVISAAPGSWLDETKVEIIGKSCTGVELPQGQQEICAGPVSLPVSSDINGALDKHRDALLKAAQATSTCDGGVKARIAEQWRPIAIRIERDQSAPLYLNIQPKAASIAGITTEDDRLRVAVRMKAETSMSSDPMERATMPLPALETAAAEAGSLNVNLPARVSYDQLSRQLMQRLGDQAFEKTAGDATIGIRVTDAQIYPAKSGLVLGLKIDAKLPGSWLNKTGWVYLTGKPNAAKDGQNIKVENLQFAPLVDTAFWTAAEPLLKNEFLTAVSGAASFDLGKGVETSMNEVRQGIAKAEIAGLKLKAGDPTSRIDGVHVADTAVIAMVKLALPVSAEIVEAGAK